VLDTGEVSDACGEQPSGCTIYTANGRILVLIVSDNDRSAPNSSVAPTDEQAAKLFRTVAAYGGTYEFDGRIVKHPIDISLNQTWTATTQIRDVQQDGDRLIYDPSLSFPGERKDERGHARLAKSQMNSVSGSRRDSDPDHCLAAPRSRNLGAGSGTGSPTRPEAGSEGAPLARSRKARDNRRGPFGVDESGTSRAFLRWWAGAIGAGSERRWLSRPYWACAPIWRIANGAINIYAAFMVQPTFHD